MPGAEVEAVITGTRRWRPGTRGEVRVVGRSIGPAIGVVVIAGNGPRPPQVASPMRIVAALKFVARSRHVRIVAGREHSTWSAVEQGGRQLSARQAAPSDIPGTNKDLGARRRGWLRAW